MRPEAVRTSKFGAWRDTDVLSGCSIKPAPPAEPVRLGTRDTRTGYFVGRLRRVAYYDRVLTDTEIASPYAARDQEDASALAVPGPVLAPTPAATADLVTDLRLPTTAGFAHVTKARDVLVEHLAY